MSLSDLTVRHARPEDDAAVGELLVDAFTAAYARKLPEVVYSEERRQALRAVAEKRASAFVWVAELEGRVVGTVTLFPPGAAGSQAWLPDTADLRHLATRPDLHGKGLSGPLLDAAERLARERGYKRIGIHVRRQAEGVARLYQQRGYTRDPAGDRDYPGVELEAYVLSTTPSDAVTASRSGT